MIKYLFLFLFPILVFADLNRQISIFENEIFWIDEQNVSFIIIDQNVISFKLENGLIKVTPNKPGVDSLTIFKQDGSNVSYFFNIKSANQKSLSLKKRNQSYLGKITYNHYLNNQNRYGNSATYYHRLLIKENLKAEFSHSYFDQNTNVQYNDLDFYTITSDDYYLSWFRQTSEPNVIIDYYSSLPYQGYVIGKKTNYFELKAWQGNQSSNKEKLDDISYKGIFISKRFELIDINFSLSNNPDSNINIPIYRLNIRDLNLYLSQSSLEDKSLTSVSFYKDFNSKSNNFTFRRFDINYAMAPNGNYNLISKNNIVKDSLVSRVMFSNRELLTEKEIERVDFLPGVSLFSLGFTNSNVDISNSKTIFSNASYGGIDRATLSLETSFSNTTIENVLKDESFAVTPKIGLIVFGNKKDGVSLRNHYLVNNSFDYFNGVETNSFSNNLGVYKNNNQVLYGAYVGSGLVSTTKDEKLKTYGLEFNYFQKNNIFKAEYTNQQTDFAKIQTFYLNSFFNYSENFVFKAGIKWSEKSNETRFLTNIIGNVGFTWIFGVGKYPIYDQLKNLNTKVKGLVFLDKNLNLKREDDEPLLTDLNITNFNESLSIRDGYYTISSYENQELKLNINSEKYAIYNPTYLAKTGINHYNISVYEKKTKELYLKLNNEEIFDVNIQFVCNNEVKNFKKEIFSEKIVIDLPSNIDCFIQLSNDENRYLIKSITNNEDKILVELDKNYKWLFFEFKNKSSSIKIANKVYNQKNIEIPLIEENDVLIEISEKCQIFPKINENKLKYNELKLQNFYKIDCFSK